MTVIINDMNIDNNRSLDRNNTFSDFEEVFDRSALTCMFGAVNCGGLPRLMDYVGEGFYEGNV